MRNVVEVLKQHQELVVQNYPKCTPWVTLCSGSQNYNLDDDNSDVDSVTIVLMSFPDMVLQKTISTTLYDEHNQHVKVVDLMTYVQRLLTPNVPMMGEIYSPFIYVNPAPELKRRWNEFCGLRGKLFSYDRKAFYRAIYGQMLGLLKECDKYYDMWKNGHINNPLAYGAFFGKKWTFVEYLLILDQRLPQLNESAPSDCMMVTKEQKKPILLRKRGLDKEAFYWKDPSDVIRSIRDYATRRMETVKNTPYAVDENVTHLLKSFAVEFYSCIYC